MEEPGEWSDGDRREFRDASGSSRRVHPVAATLGLVVTLLVGSTLVVFPAAAQDEPEPTTPPTTEPAPTTAPPTTAPPTTEAPTTLPPTTEAPQPTTPPTTSGGGGGGTVRPTVPTTSATTEPPSTTTTTPRSTVVAPAPGAVTVPEEVPAAAEDEPGGPWLSPDTQLRIAVGGLVVLAVVMVGLTLAYWRHTRPTRTTPLVGVGDTGDAVLAAGDLAPGAAPVGGEGSDAADEDILEQPAAVPGGSPPPPAPTPTPASGYSAAPPSALPPPSLGLRSVPTSGTEGNDVDR